MDRQHTRRPRSSRQKIARAMSSEKSDRTLGVQSDHRTSLPNCEYMERRRRWEISIESRSIVPFSSPRLSFIGRNYSVHRRGCVGIREYARLSPPNLHSSDKGETRHHTPIMTGKGYLGKIDSRIGFQPCEEKTLRRLHLARSSSASYSLHTSPTCPDSLLLLG